MRILLLLISLCFASPLYAAWHKAETKHFIFYANTSEKDVRADAERLERFDALMRKRSGIADDGGQTKLTVYVLSDIEAVKRAYGGGNSSNVAGFYRATWSGAIAVVPKGAGEKNFSDIVLFHEYAHHLMLQYFSTAYPAWYVEGFAEFLSTTEFEPDSARIGVPAQHRAYELLGQDIKVPIETLLSSTVGDLKARQVGNFYGRSWLLLHYLTFTKAREGQMRAYLQLINKGTPILDAAKQAFGDLDLLDRELNRYVKQPSMSVMKMPDMAPADFAIKITKMSDVEGEAALVGLALSSGTTKDTAPPLARRLRALDKKLPNNAAILTLLAEAEHDSQNYPAAIEAADAALKIDPNGSRAMLWRGMAIARPLIDSKDKDPTQWKLARSWIVKANRANTEDALPLYLYYTSFENEGRQPPAVALEGLGKAVALLPQAGQFRMSYAFALMRAGRYGEAAAVLQPLANSPHGGAGVSAVRAIVSKLNDAESSKAKLDVAALQALLDDQPATEEDGKKDGDEKDGGGKDKPAK